MNEVRPSDKEKTVLSLFYNRFYDLYDEILKNNFFENNPNDRFFKIKEIFSIYKELIGYKPLKYYLKHIKSGGRPELEGIIAEDLFSFIRNVLLHFPLFNNWDEVYITKNLATWNTVGSIDKFLNKCVNIKIDKRGTVKYRIWQESKKTMTYININFPEEYGNEKKIYLNKIIEEKDGIIFCISLMKQILDSQVEGSDKADIVIMSQVYSPIQKEN